MRKFQSIDIHLTFNRERLVLPLKGHLIQERNTHLPSVPVNDWINIIVKKVTDAYKHFNKFKQQNIVFKMLNLNSRSNKIGLQVFLGIKTSVPSSLDTFRLT